VLFLNGQPTPIALESNHAAMTALVPKKYLETAGKNVLSISDPVSGLKSVPVVFEVTAKE